MGIGKENNCQAGYGVYNYFICRAGILKESSSLNRKVGARCSWPDVNRGNNWETAVNLLYIFIAKCPQQ
jgi:hypothetical protein